MGSSFWHWLVIRSIQHGDASCREAVSIDDDIDALLGPEVARLVLTGRKMSVLIALVQTYGADLLGNDLALV